MDGKKGMGFMQKGRSVTGGMRGQVGNGLLAGSGGSIRGQSGTEFLVMFAVGLAFVTGAFVIGSVYSNQSLGASQAQDAVGRLAQSADYVYTLGPNSKEYVEVYFPRELSSVNASGKRLLFKLDAAGGGNVDFFANTKAELIDAMPKSWGQQKILVQYLPSGKVLLGEAGLQCSPAYINGANNTPYPITVTNVLDTTIGGINLAIEGSVDSVADIDSTSPSPLVSLNPGQAGTVNVKFVANAAGNYGGDLLVTSDNGTCVTSLSMSVGGGMSCSALCRQQGGYARGNCEADLAVCQLSGGDEVDTSFSASSCTSPEVCCCGPISDTIGPNITSFNITGDLANNDITVKATCDDMNRGNSKIRSARTNLEWGAWASMSASDGTFEDSIVQDVNYTFSGVSGGGHVVCAQCKDAKDNLGETRCDGFNVTANDTDGPFISIMSHTSVANLAYTEVNITGTAIDIPFVGSNATVAGCYFKVDPSVGDPMPGPGACPSWTAATPVSPATYGTSRTQSFKAALGTLGTGKVHKVCEYCKDSLGNCGVPYIDPNTSMYCLSIGVPMPDIMIALQTSSSMCGTPYVQTVFDSGSYNTSDTSYTTVKAYDVDGLGAMKLYEIKFQLAVNKSGCKASAQAWAGSTFLFNGSSTSVSPSFNTIGPQDVSGISLSAPFTVNLTLKVNASGCTAYVRNFNITQKKIEAAKDGAKLFVNITDNNTQVGYERYRNQVVPDTHLTMMDSSGKAALIARFDGTPYSGDCQQGQNDIAEAIDAAVAELNSTTYGRPGAAKALIILSDESGSPGDWVDAAQNARVKNVVIYTISYSTANEPTLLSISQLTGGKYYYTPDATTLKTIFKTIGT